MFHDKVGGGGGGVVGMELSLTAGSGSEKKI